MAWPRKPSEHGLGRGLLAIRSTITSTAKWKETLQYSSRSYSCPESHKIMYSEYSMNGNNTKNATTAHSQFHPPPFGKASSFHTPRDRRRETLPLTSATSSSSTTSLSTQALLASTLTSNCPHADRRRIYKAAGKFTQAFFATLSLAAFSFSYSWSSIFPFITITLPEPRAASILMATPTLLTTTTTESTTRPTVRPRTNRTLVVVTGSLRSGEAAWESLYRHVLDVNNADLAVITEDWTPPQYRNASLFQRAKYLWKVHKYEDWSDAMDLIYNTTDWRQPLFDHYNYQAGKNIMLGGVRGVSASGGIIFMFRWFLANYIHELNLTEQYDRFVITRSDHYYLCPHNLSGLDLDYLWVPEGEDWGGICDRHFVASHRDILAALNTIAPLVADPLKYQHLLSRRKFNSEGFLLHRWKEDGLGDRIRRFARMMFVSANAHDETRWKVRLDKPVKEGVHIKYPKEYYHSLGTCSSSDSSMMGNSRWLSSYLDIPSITAN